MLAANVCTSDFLRSNDHPMLYRIHEGPTPEKLAALREFLKGFGLQLGGGDDPHAGDYAKLLARAKDRPDAQLLQTVMLRSLQQAVYSPDNVGHFGLAYESYTHFTSPIRRYPDLLVHRAIKAVLQRQRYDPGNWHELGAHCSMTERRADDATRDVVAWLKCYYMKDRVGETFTGSISGVTSFGAFVALDGVYVEGLVHVSDLGNDYFHFDPARAPAHGGAHPQALSPWRPAAGEGGARGSRYQPNRFHAGVKSIKRNIAILVKRASPGICRSSNSMHIEALSYI